MAKDQSIGIQITGDSSSLEKALESTARKMQQTRKESAKTKDEVNILAKSFSNASNQVAILQGPLGPVAGRLSAISTGLRGLGVGGFAAAAGLTAITSSVGRAISGLDNYQERQIRFNNLLEVTGNRAGTTAIELEKMASSFGMRTLSSTEEGAKALNILISTTDISADKFEKLLDTAFGASQVLNRGFIPTVRTLAKALSDPARNASTLANTLGTKFSPELNKSIQELEKMGDTAGATDKILDLLGDTYSKFASGEAGGKAGELDSLGESWDKFWESVGRTDTMKSANNVLRDLIVSSTESLNSFNKLHDPDPQQRLNALLKEQNDITNSWLASATSGIDSFTNGILFGLSPALTLLATSQRDIEELTKDIAKARSDVMRMERKQVEQQIEGSKLQLRNDLAGYEKRISAIKDLQEAESKTSLIAGESKEDKVTRQSKERLEEIKKNLEERLEAERNASIARGELFDKSTVEEREAAAAQGRVLLSKYEEQAKFEDLEAKLRAEYAQIEVSEQEALQTKLIGIRKVANDKRVAEQQRAFRDFQAISIALAGGDEEARIKASYDSQVEKYRTMTFEKIKLAEFGVETEEELREKINKALAKKYREDLKEYRDAEAEKNKVKIDSAGIMASIRSITDIDLGEIKGESGFFENLFGVDLENTESQLQQMEQLYKDTFNRIAQSSLESEEKKALNRELYSKIAKEQAEIQKQGEVKAATDTWDALQTLGATGNKKLFALAKAGKIAQSIMNTYQAATNALANIPSPFNIPAAAVITAAGLANVASIRAQQPPQFHDGISTVPREGTYLLDGGERVLDSRLNGDLKDYLSRSNNTGSGATSIEFNVTATDTGGFDMWYNDNRDMIVRDIEYARARG